MGLIDTALSIVTGGGAEEDPLSGVVRQHQTRIYASFHSDEGFDGVVDYDWERGNKSPFRVIGYTYQKRFASQPGKWKLTVKSNGDDLLRLWQDPEDVWVRIIVVKDGVYHDRLLGLIDTVTESMSRNDDGSRNLVYQINGSDHHKVFAKSQIFINIHEHDGKLPAVPLYDAVNKGILGTPTEILKTLLEAWLGNEGVGDKQWKMPSSLGGEYFFDVLELDFGETRGKIVEPALLNPETYLNQNLWQLIEEFSNGLLNELYVDIERQAEFREYAPYPKLVLRERPFPTMNIGTRNYESLVTTRLFPGDVRGRDVSKGAPESRFNYWLLDGKGLVGNGLGVIQMIQAAAERSGGFPGSAPIYDTDSVRRHGLRRWFQATRYIPFRDKELDFDPLVVSAQWLNLLHDWYAIGPYELTGTFNTTSLFPDVYIGNRIIEQRRDGSEVTYYVEGVTDNWQYPGPGSTTINVTRGEYAEENLLDIVYDRLLAQQRALDSMLEAAVGLVQDTAELASSVPTGSGPQLDRVVGQVDKPERIFLKQRGKDHSDKALKRGELTYTNDKRTRVTPSKLPNRQLPNYMEEGLGADASPTERTVNGLTQRELENGTRLRISDDARLEPAKRPADKISEEQTVRKDKTKTRRRR